MTKSLCTAPCDTLGDPTVMSLSPSCFGLSSFQPLHASSYAGIILLLHSWCTCRFDSNHPAPTALPVPFVPGALLLQGVLSAAECQQIIAAAEAIGWHSDVDYTFGGAAGDDGGKQQQEQHQPQQEDVAQPTAQPSDQEQQQQDDTLEPQPPSAQPFNGANPAETATAAAGDDGGDDVGVAAGAGGSAARGLAAGLAGVPEGTPAAGCVWLADDSVLQPLYDRVSHLLPAEIEGGAYAGINARWRLYRYT